MSLKSLLVAASLLANFVLAALLFLNAIDGCAEISDGKTGVLTKDVKVGVFGTNGIIFHFAERPGCQGRFRHWHRSL